MPTPQDIRNASYRAKVAAEQRDAYTRVLRLAVGKFGPGWLPSGRHYLVEKEAEELARATGTKPVIAAEVFTVTNGASKRHFALVGGKPKEFPTWEEGFGDMLHERHATAGFTHNGEFCRTARYSLCWAGYEPNYAPKTAEQLAAARISREKNKAERADRKWAEENPLLSWAERVVNPLVPDSPER